MEVVFATSLLQQDRNLFFLAGIRDALLVTFAAPAFDLAARFSNLHFSFK